MTSSTRNILALAFGAVLLVGASSATTAVATTLITGDDIADRSITGADIKRDSVPGNRLKPGSVRIEHLDRASIRAGHVHSDVEPMVVDPTAADAPQATDSSRGVNLVNGVTTTVSTLSNVPAGTYAVVATGSISLIAASYNGTYYQNVAYCSIIAGTTTVNFQTYAASPYNTTYNSVVALSRVVTLTAPGSISVTCKPTLSTPNPPTGIVASAGVDLMALPVNSYSAG